MKPNQAQPDTDTLRYTAADLVTRVIALMKSRQTRRALVRVIQLNSLCRDYPDLVAQHVSLPVFVRFGKHFCAKPNRMKMKSLFLLCKSAKPTLDSLLDFSLDEHHAIGAKLSELKVLVPRVLASGVKPVMASLKYKERAGRSGKDKDLIDPDDAYVLQYAGVQRIKELGPGQSGIIRASVSLTRGDLSEAARRACCVEYGILTIMRMYQLFTEAMLVGIAKHNHLGDERPTNELTEHAQMLLNIRNKARVKAGLDALAAIGPTVSTQDHVYHLLFDARFVVSNEIIVKHFEFYRIPGTAPVRISNSGQR